MHNTTTPNAPQVPQTYGAADDDGEKPRLTIIPVDDDEPTIDTGGAAILLDCTEVMSSVGSATQAHYRFPVRVEDVPDDERPALTEGDPCEMVYSAGQTGIPLYGDVPASDGEGAVATMNGYLDEKVSHKWTVVTQKLPTDNDINDVHNIAKP